MLIGFGLEEGIVRGSRTKLCNFNLFATIIALHKMPRIDMTSDWSAYLSLEM